VINHELKVALLTTAICAVLLVVMYLMLIR
jgi:hypothetical protein